MMFASELPPLVARVAQTDVDSGQQLALTSGGVRSRSTATHRVWTKPLPEYIAVRSRPDSGGMPVQRADVESARTVPNIGPNAVKVQES